MTERSQDESHKDVDTDPIKDANYAKFIFHYLLHATIRHSKLIQAFDQDSVDKPWYIFDSPLNKASDLLCPRLRSSNWAYVLGNEATSREIYEFEASLARNATMSSVGILVCIDCRGTKSQKLRKTLAMVRNVYEKNPSGKHGLIVLLFGAHSLRLELYFEQIGILPSAIREHQVKVILRKKLDAPDLGSSMDKILLEWAASRSLQSLCRVAHFLSYYNDLRGIPKERVREGLGKLVMVLEGGGCEVDDIALKHYFTLLKCLSQASCELSQRTLRSELETALCPAPRSETRIDEVACEGRMSILVNHLAEEVVATMAAKSVLENFGRCHILLYGESIYGKESRSWIDGLSGRLSESHLVTVMFNVAQFYDKHVGEAEKNVAAFFKHLSSPESFATDVTGVVIVLEGIELFDVRNNDSEHFKRSFLAMMLTCLDGIESGDSAAMYVRVIGCSSHAPEQLDSSLTRPGRFGIWLPFQLN